MAKFTAFPAEAYAEIIRAKDRGNDAFKKASYKEAAAEYGRALSYCTVPTSVNDAYAVTPLGLDPNTTPLDIYATLRSNRAAAYLHLKMLEEAETDSTEVIKVRPDWVKGYFRLAEIFKARLDLEQAEKLYRKALEKDPSDRLIHDRLSRLRVLKTDKASGLTLHQLMPGDQICKRSFLAPIQNMIYEYAKQMRNFIYLIENNASKECLVVDACWDIDGILKYASDHRLKVVGAIVTHYHVDHIGGLPPPPFDKYRIRVDGLAKLLKKLPSIKAYVNPADIPGILKASPEIAMDRFVHTKDGETMCLPLSLNANRPSGTLDFPDGRSTIMQFIHTPGHTPGSQCILVNGSRLISGDTLFIGSCGRVDFPDSDKHAMHHSLQVKLGGLPDEVVVYPGHNYGGDMTTIGVERRTGVLRPETIEEFVKEREHHG
ncbi:hypothetical protein HDU85_000046 [Gaertneriomyces sp. JEL0708]|nr:hypothetical protein HDU85_000046 [Gaertneriomyces sp. JEL0708]